MENSVKYAVERLFTKKYAKDHLPAAVVAGVVTGYGFYTMASAYTYQRARDKIDGAVNALLAVVLKPVLTAFGATAGLDTIIAVAISALEDFGSGISTTLVPIPTGKTAADTIDAGALKAVSLVIGIAAGITTYVVIDHLVADVAGSPSNRSTEAF